MVAMLRERSCMHSYVLLHNYMHSCTYHNVCILMGSVYHCTNYNHILLYCIRPHKINY